MIRLRVPALVLITGLALAACGSSAHSVSSGAGSPSAGGGSSLPAVSGALGAKPTIARASGPAPTTLVTHDVAVGTGAVAKAGDTLSVQYDGALYANDQEFDASWNRGATPFSFTLGAGMVIQGWDQGLVGMKVGGRRELVIPPSLGYGSQANQAIPADSTLVFVVDLVSVKAS